MVPIRVSREVSFVPDLETRLVKAVEFQAGRSGRWRSIAGRLRWALSRMKEEIGLSADIRESRISFNSRAGFKLLAISAVWLRLAWRFTMFEGADIREFTYIGEPTLVLMGGQ